MITKKEAKRIKSYYEPKYEFNGQEYGLAKEDDFRSSLKFCPDELNIFYASSYYRRDSDSSQTFGWFPSYGGTLMLPRHSQNIFISTEGLSWKELSYLTENFNGFGEFLSYGKTLKWCYKER